MEEQRIDQIISDQNEEVVDDRQLRTPVTILFSDIRGSTAYFEQHGDIKGMAMVERHNALLFPCVEGNHGRIVKTIGDAIMALFNDPVDAVTAAAHMQLALENDNSGRESGDEIHIRIGVHTGLGLLRDNDVFGDVVNAAARVQSQSDPDQILITDSLLSAAATAGFQVGKLGRAKMKGKDEPIDVYAVGWSAGSTQQLIDDLCAKFEAQVQEVRQARVDLEEQFDASRDEWREERRSLNAELEKLEERAADALESAREQLTSDLQKQAQFKVEAADRQRVQAEEELARAQERFESERAGYKSQISRLENRIVEAMEQVNNPARAATEVREQVQKRLDEARQEWQAQWDADRKRLQDEIERVKSAGPKDPMAEARRLMMERIKAKQEGRTVGEGEDLKAAREQAEAERDEALKKVASLEREVQRANETARQEAFDELRVKYDQKAEQAERVKSQLQQEIRSLTEQLEGAKESTASRLRQMERSITDAEEAARAEAASSVRSELEARLDESDRMRSRLERRQQEAEEEWAAERSRFEKQIQNLESNLEQAREMAFKRSSDPTVDELNRLRRQLEEEFRLKTAAWEEEKVRLTEKISQLEHPPS